MDEVIDDLISLESGFNDGGLDCMESNIIMQNNVSMNYISSCQSRLKMLTHYCRQVSRTLRPNILLGKRMGGDCVQLRSA